VSQKINILNEKNRMYEGKNRMNEGKKNSWPNFSNQNIQNKRSESHLVHLHASFCSLESDDPKTKIKTGVGMAGFKDQGIVGNEAFQCA
jgi:hypothetical protein